MLYRAYAESSQVKLRSRTLGITSKRRRCFVQLRHIGIILCRKNKA